MFDQLKQLKGLAGMMGNLPQLREKMEQMQAELASQTVTGEAGAGAVRVTVNGKLQVTAVQLDPAMIATFVSDTVDDTDRELIEELIVSATNQAMQRAQELVAEQMAKVTGGLNIAGMLPPAPGS